MTYYFNSQEQIAAQRGLQSSKGFKDALAYVLTEIILTTSDVMQETIKKIVQNLTGDYFGELNDALHEHQA